MDTPVYKFFLYKPRLAAFEQPPEKLEEYLQKNEAILRDTGGRRLIMGSLWSTERFVGFGVELFPNWKSLREHIRCLDELHWFQLIDSEVVLGLDSADNPNRLEPLNLDPNVDYIAHMYLARYHEPFYSISEADMAEAMKVFDLEKELGVVSVVHGYSRPIDEKWNGWGVELYPSMEALAQKAQAQEKVNWWKYIDAKTYLGTANGGELLGK